MTRTALSLVVALLTSGAAAPVAAQQADSIALGGRVVGPAMEALAGQVVVLHRVAGGTGATIATDTTSEDGRFTLVAAGQAGDAEATYFVAARYQGDLYIGAPFRPPLPPDVDYTVQVGVPGTSATALLGTAAPQRPAPGRIAPGQSFPYTTWLFLIIPLLVMALAAGYMLTRQRGPVRRRGVLLEIAELDEAHDAELAAGRVSDSTMYWAQRRELLERLPRES